MENEVIEDLKNEFYAEYKSKKISVDDLKKAGVSESLLKTEIFLRNIYGDDIILNEEVETVVDLAQKKVEKVDLTEINKISELTKLIDNVSNTDFDRFVEVINSKATKE